MKFKRIVGAIADAEPTRLESLAVGCGLNSQASCPRFVAAVRQG